MPEPKTKDPENKKKDAASVAKEKINDAKAEAKAGKKAEMKGLRPVKHYDKAATSTDDFVKPEVETEDDEEQD